MSRHCVTVPLVRGDVGAIRVIASDAGTRLVVFQRLGDPPLIQARLYNCERDKLVRALLPPRGMGGAAPNREPPRHDKKRPQRQP